MGSMVSLSSVGLLTVIDPDVIRRSVPRNTVQFGSPCRDRRSPWASLSCPARRQVRRAVRALSRPRHRGSPKCRWASECPRTSDVCPVARHDGLAVRPPARDSNAGRVDALTVRGIGVSAQLGCHGCLAPPGQSSESGDGELLGFLRPCDAADGAHPRRTPGAGVVVPGRGGCPFSRRSGFVPPRPSHRGPLYLRTPGEGS